MISSLTCQLLRTVLCNSSVFTNLPFSLPILSSNSIPLSFASTHCLMSVLNSLGLVLQPHTQSVLENCLWALRESMHTLFVKYLRASKMAHRVMALGVRPDD